MSDRARSDEIDDVLASIRRLVSDQSRGTDRNGRREAAEETGKLILTPALRIADPVDPWASIKPQLPDPEPDQDAAADLAGTSRDGGDAPAEDEPPEQDQGIGANADTDAVSEPAQERATDHGAPSETTDTPAMDWSDWAASEPSTAAPDDTETGPMPPLTGSSPAAPPPLDLSPDQRIGFVTQDDPGEGGETQADATDDVTEDAEVTAAGAASDLEDDGVFQAPETTGEDATPASTETSVDAGRGDQADDAIIPLRMIMPDAEPGDGAAEPHEAPDEMSVLADSIAADDPAELQEGLAPGGAEDAAPVEIEAAGEDAALTDDVEPVGADADAHDAEALAPSDEQAAEAEVTAGTDASDTKPLEIAAALMPEARMWGSEGALDITDHAADDVPQAADEEPAGQEIVLGWPEPDPEAVEMAGNADQPMALDVDAPNLAQDADPAALVPDHVDDAVHPEVEGLNAGEEAAADVTREAEPDDAAVDTLPSPDMAASDSDPTQTAETNPYDDPARETAEEAVSPPEADGPDHPEHEGSGVAEAFPTRVFEPETGDAEWPDASGAQAAMDIAAMRYGRTGASDPAADPGPWDMPSAASAPDSDAAGTDDADREDSANAADAVLIGDIDRSDDIADDAPDSGAIPDDGAWDLSPVEVEAAESGSDTPADTPTTDTEMASDALAWADAEPEPEPELDAAAADAAASDPDTPGASHAAEAETDPSAEIAWAEIGWETPAADEADASLDTDEGAAEESDLNPEASDEAIDGSDHASDTAPSTAEAEPPIEGHDPAADETTAPEEAASGAFFSRALSRQRPHPILANSASTPADGAGDTSVGAGPTAETLPGAPDIAQLGAPAPEAGADTGPDAAPPQSDAMAADIADTDPDAAQMPPNDTLEEPASVTPLLTLARMDAARRLGQDATAADAAPAEPAQQTSPAEPAEPAEAAAMGADAVPSATQTDEPGIGAVAFDADPSGELEEPEWGELDEEALRELIAEVVREELQGALGQRITRNVRKMVRREIRLALAAETLE